MRNASVWRTLLGLVKVVVEGVDIDEEAEALIVSVRPRKGNGQAALRGVRTTLCGL